MAQEETGEDMVAFPAVDTGANCSPEFSAYSCGVRPPIERFYALYSGGELHSTPLSELLGPPQLRKMQVEGAQIRDV